ncbi:MAG: HAD family hydrolase [Eubacteriales bacterium]
MYEFNDKSATKGTALVRLKKLLIDTGRATEKLKIYAVGDYENDLDMLRHADVPSLPRKRDRLSKKIAKLHVCHCDDGAIADAIDAIGKTK